MMATTTEPKTGERTGAQATPQNTITRYLTTTPIGVSPLPASYDTYRQIRRDPTIALARALAVAPIVAAEWSVEADKEIDQEAIDLVSDQFLPIRQPLMESALLGGIDFGHEPYEKVWEEKDGYLRIAKFKPLLHDITTLLVNEDTGAFEGIKNGSGEGITKLPLPNCLLIYFRVEGTNWYGEPLMENARATWNEWRDANKGAARYDRVVAGSRYIIRHPDGESVDPTTGRRLPNWQLADELMQKLEAVKPVVMPDLVAGYAEGLNRGNQKWQIEILEDASGRQPTFIDRLRYLDSLKCRAMLIPERSILEGQYGTKAEAGEQIDLALTNADLTHRWVTLLLNWHAVDQLLAVNLGEKMRGKVRLVANPIRDAKLATMRDVYLALLANPGALLEEFGTMDTDSLKDALGVPKLDSTAQAGEGLGGGETTTTDALPGAASLEGVDAGAVQAAFTRMVYAALEG